MRADAEVDDAGNASASGLESGMEFAADILAWGIPLDGFGNLCQRFHPMRYDTVIRWLMGWDRRDGGGLPFQRICR